jgi:hypothetical protein
VRDPDPIRFIVRTLRAPLDLDADVFRYRVRADGHIIVIPTHWRWCARSSCRQIGIPTMFGDGKVTRATTRWRKFSRRGTPSL